MHRSPNIAALLVLAPFSRIDAVGKPNIIMADEMGVDAVSLSNDANPGIWEETEQRKLRY